MAIDGTVAEQTSFGPPHCFCYELSMSPTQTTVSATFEEGRLAVHVPTSVIREWAATDQVSIHAVQRYAEGSELRILIEKDFECIDAPKDESQEDAFQNPQIGAAC
jgi:hypothetical protein